MIMSQREEKEERELKVIIIPEEICALEILPHVPGHELMQQMAVCKDWARLIGSPYFVGLHLSRGANRIRVVKAVNHIRYQTKKKRRMLDEGIYAYDMSEKAEMIIPYPPKVFCKYELPPAIVGSVDGLICIIQLIWIRDRLDKYEIAGEYVLVLLQYHFRSNLEVVVYKFTTNSKLNRIRSTPANYLRHNGYIEFSSVSYLDHRGILVHGSVHWLMRWTNADIIARNTSNKYLYRYGIVAYHLESNTSLQFSPPVQYCEFSLGAMHGCLCATLKEWDSTVFGLWIRRQEDCSWTKHANIQLDGSFRHLHPLEFFPSTCDLLLNADHKFIKYNLNHNRATLLKDYVYSGNPAIVCADTLLPPSICRL